MWPIDNVTASSRGRLALAFAFACNAILAAHAEGQQRRLAYQLPGMNQVRQIANIPYRSLVGSADTVMYGPNLAADVFLPADSAILRAGVIFVHGGLVPDTQRVSPKDDLPAYREWGRLVAASGMVAITFSHRLTTNDDIDVAAQDVLELLRLVRARAVEWKLDVNRLCIAFFSAGGPLSGSFIDGAERGVRCLVLYYPFLDVEHTAAISPFRRAHTPARVAELRRYSPRERLLAATGQVPPLLLARAGLDAIPGINASIDRFVQAALWVNAPLELHVHPTGPHGFDMTEAPDETAEHIVHATIEFIRRHTTARSNR